MRCMGRIFALLGALGCATAAEAQNVGGSGGSGGNATVNIYGGNIYLSRAR